MRKIAVRTVVGAVLACVLRAGPARAQATVDPIHAFAGLPGSPASRPIQASNGLFYGTLLQGGPVGAGTVFAASVSPAGRLVPVTLHVFTRSDGRSPVAGLVQASDGAFYGTTAAGGASDDGTVFRITAQGQFTLLHSFGGPDGSGPVGELIQAADGRLYGTTSAGGAGDMGTLFAITPAGEFTSLHSFAGPDGIHPLGALVQASDGNFYGTAYLGGTGAGTVFRLTAEGTVDVLHTFDLQDGAAGLDPWAGLIQGRDGALYGTTAAPNGGSSAFRITLSGELTVLFRFLDLGSAYGGVIQGQDGALYGTCVPFTDTRGTVFRLGMDGALTVLHTFSGADGALPFGGLVQASDGGLYGLTMLGGTVNRGTAYRVTTSGLFASLYSITGFGGAAPSGGVIRASDGNLYGTTNAGGLINGGTVFRLNASGDLTLLHEFTGPDGASPGSGLFQAGDGLLYGVTGQGGAHGRGTIFAMTVAGAFVTLHHFTEAESAGGSRTSALIQGDDGMLYGIAPGQFSVQPSVAFRITPAGVFAVLATIPDANGPLVEGADGNFYGTTAPQFASSSVQGSVFRLTPGGAVTTLAQFACASPTGPCPNGADPAGGLVAASDGALYGVTTISFSAIQGTVFRVNQDGLAAIAHFTQGDAPASRLVQATDGRFYVAAGFPGQLSDEIYSVSSNGDLVRQHVFFSTEGWGLGPLLETEPGLFLGTASQGGPYDHGVVYRLTVPPSSP